MSILSAEATTSKRSPVLIMAAVMGGLQILLGGAALADFMDPAIIGMGNLLLAAVGGGYAIYTKGMVTPWADVVAKVTPTGAVVAGPASASPTGSEVTVRRAKPNLREH